jgi:hypothetical protein
MSEVKMLYKKIKLLEDELSALKAAHAVVIQTALWDNEYHSERIKVAQETNQNQAIKIDELKDENERLESLVDAEIQEIGKLRVERDALQASIDDAPTWTIKNGKLDNWNSLTSLDFHNKTVTVALVQKSEHTAEPLGECTDNI